MQITKALQQGEKPQPGPVRSEEDEVLAQLVAPVQVADENAAPPSASDAGPPARAPQHEHDTPDLDRHVLPQAPGTHTPPSSASHGPTTNRLPEVPNDAARSPPVHVVQVPTPSAPPARTVPAPTVTAPPPETSSSLSVTEIAKVQKLSRWASSALDYEDVDTARQHLHEALHILDGAR